MIGIRETVQVSQLLVGGIVDELSDSQFYLPCPGIRFVGVARRTRNRQRRDFVPSRQTRLLNLVAINSLYGLAIDMHCAFL